MATLITGANRGIGLGLYEHYRDLDQPVFGTARDGQPPFLPLDVRDPTSHAALARDLDGTAIELLICNAGIFADKSENLNTGYAPNLWADTFATNVAGVFHTVQALLPNLRAADNARIAIIASDMATAALANGGAYIYRASKAASVNLGRNLASDLRAEGIAVGIYHPGWVVTEMGGADAQISVATSVTGLTACFAELSLQSTGCFLSWDGSPLPN